MSYSTTGGGRTLRFFAAGLRGALREDPDVILLGELRDAETIRLALTAAETGHLVLATLLHTRGAVQAIARLVDTFSATEKDPVRNQLADSLRAVLSQKLEEDKLGGRVALFELLVNTPAVGNLIREGENASATRRNSNRATDRYADICTKSAAASGAGTDLVTLLEIAFEDDHGRSGIYFAFIQRPVSALFEQAGAGLDGAQAFIVQRYGYAKATVNTVNELTRARGKGAVLCHPC